MFSWTLRKAIDMVERRWNCDASHVRDVIDTSSRAARVVSSVAHLVTGAVLVCVFGLAVPAAAQASAQPPAVSPYTLTPERIAASTAALVGLISAVIGGVALARSAGRVGAGNGRRAAMAALAMGPIALIIGGLVVATADGGLGTGNGLAGGIVAMVVGLLGSALGWRARAALRRIA